MNITAAMVKELRERTSAGMMECKKALVEANGDLDEAVVLMRKSGQIKAAKRAGKVAAEGVVVIELDQAGKHGFMIEINCETDFVARDQHLKQFADQVVKRGLELKSEDIEALLKAPFNVGSADTIDDVRKQLVAKIGENIQLRRAKYISAAGMVGRYNHGSRIGVLIALDNVLPELAMDLAMHITASNPQAVSAKDISAELIEKEKEIFVAQARESGKPDNIIEKMISGRIDKFLKEICLVGQPFIKNPDQTVENLLKQHKAQVETFARFEVGEGIEKEVSDFAQEVKAQLQEG